MITVIIPCREADLQNARELVSTLSGYDQLIIETGGDNPASARNLGASKAVGDEILFLDADMRLDPGIDLSILKDYCADVATARYKARERYITAFQNTEALMGWPGAIMGGFMYMKKSVYEAVGGFREDIEWGEDVEFACRASLLGYKISAFSFGVIHTRAFSKRYRMGVRWGPLVTSEGFWGIPSLEQFERRSRNPLVAIGRTSVAMVVTAAEFFAAELWQLV